MRGTRRVTRRASLRYEATLLSTSRPERRQIGTRATGIIGSTEMAAPLFQEERDGSLLTGHAVSGVYPQQGTIALDGKTLRGSFANFRDRAAAQVLSAFATDTALVLAHVDIAEKSKEIPAAQTLLAELGVAAGAIVALDAMHCQKNISRSPRKPNSP